MVHGHLYWSNDKMQKVCIWYMVLGHLYGSDAKMQNLCLWWNFLKFLQVPATKIRCLLEVREPYVGWRKKRNEIIIWVKMMKSQYIGLWLLLCRMIKCKNCYVLWPYWLEKNVITHFNMVIFFLLNSYGATKIRCLSEVWKPICGVEKKEIKVNLFLYR
jgi:hypothetical protein